MIMNSLIFWLRGNKEGDLLDDEDIEREKERLLDSCSKIKPGAGTVLLISFSYIRYTAGAQIADLIVPAMRRIASGEYPGVHIAVSSLEEQHRSEMGWAMRGTEKVIIGQRSGPGTEWSLYGKLMKSYAVALDQVMEKGSITARELMNAMGYNTVNEASTKLSKLYSLGVLAREPDKGISFRYYSLLAPKPDDTICSGCGTSKGVLPIDANSDLGAEVSVFSARVNVSYPPGHSLMLCLKCLLQAQWRVKEAILTCLSALLRPMSKKTR